MASYFHFLLRLLLVGVFLSSFSRAGAEGRQLTVDFLDVGQGDATLFISEEWTILVDAGRHDRDDLLPLLQERAVKTIDILIATHPHADHIGQLPQVLEEFDVVEVWAAGSTHTTVTFERFLDAILASDAGYREPRAEEFYAYGDLVLEILNPADLISDLHVGSLSFRAVFGDVAFVFTGDAEHATELAMVDRGAELTSQILQLCHHGSATSSHPVFLDAVAAEVAIFSAEFNSRYGHPHMEVIDRLTERDTVVYGTATHGTVRVVTDGGSYTVQPSRDKVLVSGSSIQGDQGPGSRINVNTGSLEELTEIVHLGEVRAREVKSLRPFTSLDGLTAVSGVGQQRLNEIIEQGVAYVGDR